MSDSSVTAGKHNDFVGGLESQGRIPGADQATSGSMFVETFPHERRQEPTEHVPQSYGEPNQNRSRGTDGSAEVNIGNTYDAELVDEVDYLRSRAAGPGGSASSRRNEQPIQFTGKPQPPAPGSRVVIDENPFATPTTAGDTLTGSTSADVHFGLGKPVAGMSSAERHHDGKPHRKEHGPLDRHGLGDKTVED